MADVTENPQVPVARTYLVTIAPGVGSDETPALVAVDLGGSDGSGNKRSRMTDKPSIATDAAGRQATLEMDWALRPQLTTGDGSHGLLIKALPDPRRAASGVQRLEVVVDGWRFELDVELETHARLRERATSARAEGGHGGPSELRAIIPGRVISVDVATGDVVEAGGRLLVLEAMKMQNEVKSPKAGTVAAIEVGPGQNVELGDLLLVIE